MYQSKLFKLLSRLKPDDLPWMQKFLHSPFYNTNQTHIDLFEYIKKYYPNFDSPKLSKEATCKKLFPKAPTNFQKLRKAMHGLSLLIEEFLVAINLRNNTFEKRKILIKEFGTRNITDLFEKGTKELIDQLETQVHRDEEYYKNIHELHLEYFGHVKIPREESIPFLIKSIEHLDYYYLLRRIRMICGVKVYDKIFDNKLEVKSLKEIRALSHQETLFQLYHLALKALVTTENEAIYKKLEHLFIENIEIIPTNDKYDLIRLLLYHLGGQINKGKEEYTIRLFDLYKTGLHHKMLIKNQIIKTVTFTNIATTGILQKQFDWVEQFIENHQQYLPSKSREDAIYLVRGLLFFHKKEYSSSIDAILNHTFSNFRLNISAKTILLRNYFEQFLLDKSYFKLLIAQTNAFEKTLRRNKELSKPKQKMYINFILYTRILANSYNQNSFRKNLFSKIENADPLILRPWLLKKIPAHLKD